MKRTTAFVTTLVMVLSLAACGNDTESARAATNEVAQGQASIANEASMTQEATAGEPTAEPTIGPAAEPTAEPAAKPAEPSVEYVEPAAEDFVYSYDEALEGIIITAYRGKTGAIRIPAEIDGVPVKQIGHGAFTSSGNVIEKIIIPGSVTSIGEVAFCQCSSLTSITIPDGVTSVGKDAFKGCDNLTVIYKGQEYTQESDTDWWM